MLIAMLTYKPIEYWVEAPGTCAICDTKFVMKSDYDVLKQNGKDVLKVHGWVVKQ